MFVGTPLARHSFQEELVSSRREVGRQNFVQPPAASKESTTVGPANGLVSGAATFYQALPLDKNKRQTRVLGLHPRQWDRELRGEFKVVSLDQQRHARYQALSYTWGTSEGSEGGSICLNSELYLPLNDNLFHALKRLRGRYRKRWIWIDAICIDQSSPLERGHQVSFMHDIYSSAESLIIWLGEPVEEDIATARPYRSAVLRSALSRTEPCWHERAWVTQEFVHARKRYICAGDVSFAYRNYKKLSKSAMQHVSGADDPRGDELILALRQKLQAMEQLERLVLMLGSDQGTKPDMFVYQRTFQRLSTSATDPRDMVYSLLSLITAEEAQIIGSDYTITCCQVYARATYASFIVRNDFDMLIGKDLRPDDSQSSSAAKGLPTWAVDFSSRPPSLMSLPRTTGLVIRRDLSTRSLVWLEPDMLSLRITAQSVGSVHAVMEFGVPKSASQFATAFFSLLRDLRANEHGQLRVKSLPTQMGAALRPTPDPTQDSWLCRVLENPLSIRKVLLAAIISYWNDVIELPPSTDGCMFSDEGLLEYFTEHCQNVACASVLFVTTSGFIGLAPSSIAMQDEILLAPNAKHPFIMRDNSDFWTFHGLAYVHGMMDGRLVYAFSDYLPPLTEYVVR